MNHVSLMENKLLTPLSMEFERLFAVVSKKEKLNNTALSRRAEKIRESLSQFGTQPVQGIPSPKKISNAF